MVVLLSAVGIVTAASVFPNRVPLASADGPAPCSSGPPPFAEAGFCATYSGFNTWYGSYGPGFPTATGWGLCAEPPASGGDYPAPNYAYAQGGAPPGAAGDWNALGFALSEGQAFGYWGGQPGQFTSDQAAAAAKLLYDTVVWGTPVPAMDPGVNAAYAAFAQWYDQARGTAAAPPQLTLALAGGGSSFVTSATDVVHLQFSGTGAPLVGQPLLLSVANGTFNSPGGPTSIGVATDAGGNAAVTVFVDGSGSGTVQLTVSAAAGVGEPGLSFFSPTTGLLNAQVLAAFSAPASLSAQQSLQGQPQPFFPTGTLSVQKAGNDTAYYGLAGAVFQVFQGSNPPVATLVTDASGATPATGPLPVGNWEVREVTAPPGYATAPDQIVAVSPNQTTVVSYTGAYEDLIVPATVTIHKVDAQGEGPLAGAVFDVRYATAANGTYDEDLGTCTTDSTGQCTPAGNDGSALLPGSYRITEVEAPPGYDLDPATASQTVTLTPGEAGSVTFSDLLLGSLDLDKSGNDPAYHGVAGATFSVTGPAPATTPVGTLTVGPSGASNTIAGLVPGSYTVTETVAPPGYQLAAPVVVAVAGGHAATTVDVVDAIQPAAVALRKVDAETGAPLAGAMFDVRYSTTANGTYDQDLGTCTTDASGRCTPAGNDGAALLPGDYQVTETQAPPGYALDPTVATQDVTLAPGQEATLVVDDHLLVPATFHKVATGNVNSTQAVGAGAVLDVHQGSANGPEVARCTTDAAGNCTTPPTLVSGTSYCWVEVAAPPGLAGGATGCFTADNAQGGQPVTVTDLGMFVAVQATKVDAANPRVTLSGAVLDLYRVDHGAGPDAPAPPGDAGVEPGQTWVARDTTETGGVAEFPLQFPGYAYCVVEHQAPANYVLDGTERCTGVLSGTTDVPAPPVAVSVPDTEATVALTAHKFNTLDPGTGIPGATYDLYVEGPPPPGGVPTPAPGGAAPVPGDTWYGRGTSGADGVLQFTVPAGYAWCLREASAPVGYALDPALHCTAAVDQSAPPSTSTVALPEVPATVHLSAHKFNALEPGTAIPGATYELLAVDPGPPGYPAQAPPAQAGASVPAGDWYWSQGTTDAQGLLSWAVPAGSAWCLHELAAPHGYVPDPAYHCTGVVTTDSPAAALTVALPEEAVPGPGSSGLGPLLAYTGGPGMWMVSTGAVLVAAGCGLVAASRRRRRTTEEGRA